jgi:SAM-dependent methyltransferase
MKPAAPLTRFRYFAERESYLRWHADVEEHAMRRAHERNVSIVDKSGGLLSFYCHAHDAWNHSKAPSADASGFINWRESGTCGVCGSITRIRLAAEWLARSASNYRDPQIYLTEQLTPLYKILLQRYPSLFGSEFVPNSSDVPSVSRRLARYLGDENAQVRHEDICALTMASDSIHLIGSFDVLEHVPAYEDALTEFYRVLAPNGQLLLTAPFLNGDEKTLVRARWINGRLEHLLPAEYHGNPTLPEDGVLCYYHFGWDLLALLRLVGFRSVALLDAWGNDTAIFGDQVAIVATK